MANDQHDVDARPSAVILAGGRSTRMGRAKAWLEFGGVPLLVHVAARLRPLVREVVVVAAVDQELPPLEARVVRDRVPALGPLPALALGLETAVGARAVALGCDTPLVRPGLVRLLLEEDAAGDGTAATIPVWGDCPQPLVAVYDVRIATALADLAARGERRLQAVVALPGVRLVPTARLRSADPEGLSFRAMNTPAEYAALRRAWEEERTQG